MCSDNCNCTCTSTLMQSKTDCENTNFDISHNYANNTVSHAIKCKSDGLQGLSSYNCIHVTRRFAII